MQFNNVTQSRAEKTRTENHEGGEAFNPASPELALTKVVINNLLEDSYYESAADSFDNVRAAFEVCADENPEFVLKLAKYARQDEGLRQIPQLLLVLAANNENTREYVRDYARSIMSRADEPLEVLAMQVELFGKSLPHSLRDGIEDAMHQYNEYQYAKWDRSSREWQYRDLLNLVHPKPRDEEREVIFEKIALGELDDYDVEHLTQTGTWENNLSEDDDRTKAEAYRDSLEDMGLFPRLRQARDMLESGISADEIYADVTDDWIRNSKVFPFRFYQAYKAVRDAGQIPVSEKNEALDFLEHAMGVATENLPESMENTMTVADISGSMRSRISADSDMTCEEISTLFTALVYRKGSDAGTVASDFNVFRGDRRDTVMTNVEKLQGNGGATNAYLVFKELREQGKEYDSIILFSDMQLWDSRGFGTDSKSFRKEWRKYKSEFRDANLYLVDLQSYGTLATPEGAEDVYQISGWSSNVVEFIDKMENVDGMIREIESTEPDE